jgi:CheY-like chemotaxis protein
MPKVLLLTFDTESREPRRKDLEEAGFTVAIDEPSWPAALEAAKRFQPDVIAVDCGQLPSHGRETAAALRTTSPADAVPLVLFRVADHDVERTRLKVPGGVVAFDWELLDRLRSAALTRLAQLAAQEDEPSAPDQLAAPAPGAAATAPAPGNHAPPGRPRPSRAAAGDRAPGRHTAYPAPAESTPIRSSRAATKRPAPRRKH